MAKKISKAVQERRRKKSTDSPLTSRNRFEVHQNRSKYNILGRKEKNDRGAPGVSRSKANEKRKKTLLQKYMQRNKSNVLVDKRFGEFDDNVSVEEKMLKRFTLEKQSHHVKAGHYNINDPDEEDQLTHYGQNLADISNFDEIDLESGDEGNEDDISGGLLRKKKTRDGKQDGGEDDEEEEKKLSKKEILQEMIVDSKRDKNERRKTKELAFELTQRLDKEWKDIHLLLTKRTDDNTAPKEKHDDYDKIVKELVFEAKGKPTERLKSAEEIAKKEARRLAKLEKDRLSRMEMEEDPDEEEEGKHLSADALIKKAEKKVDDRYILQYKNGEMVLPEGFQEGLIPDVGGVEEEGEEGQEEEGMGDGEEEEEEEEEDEEEEDDEDVFSEDENVESDDEKDENKEIDADEEEEEEDDDEDDDGEEEEGVEEEEEEEEEEEGKVIVDVKKSDTTTVSSKKSSAEEPEVTKKTKKKSTTAEVLTIPKKSTKTSKENQNKKPDHSIPANLEKLLNIIKNKSKTDILSYLSKIRTANIATKKSLAKFVDLIFEYVDHVCNEEKPTLQNINTFSNILLDLSQDVTSHLTKVTQRKLKTMFKRISSCVKDRNHSDACLQLDELMLLKIIDAVYPTSDLSHAITTPALLLISYVFVKTRPVDVRSAACGILLLDIVHGYVKLSKRYLPELILYLSRVLYEAVDVTGVVLNKFTSSALNMHRKENGCLYADQGHEDLEIQSFDVSILSKSSTSSAQGLEEPAVKLACIRNLLLVCQKFGNLYSELETFAEVMEPIAVLLRHLPINNYPDSLKTLHSNVTEAIATKCESRSEKVALKLQARKPIPLTLLEPAYEDTNSADVFRKRGSGDKAKNEHDKLKYKVKRELKGAVKEIRKDTQFLAKQQLSEQLSKDATRKRKVKELKNALENERREIKEMEKGSKKSR